MRLSLAEVNELSHQALMNSKTSRQNAASVADSITNSYACGVVGHLVEPLARQGLLALAFANSPANIAPWGGSDPLFGTNPLAVAVPRKDHDPMIIDQSSSVVTKVALLEKAAQDLPLPKGWAFDRQGKPTLDAQKALQGSMAPAGGYKGVGIALLVEIMAAGLTGANWSFLASSFGNDEGGPPRTGQFMVAVNCSAFGENRFLERFEFLCSRILNQEGTRLPSDRRWALRARAEREGIYVEKELIEKIESYCS
jgi:(2R)-3-sulfolactate dehydrogenase (NADP+)